VILPPETPEIIEYRCNICGASNQLASREFHRELALCASCGSNARFRGIVHVLANFLGESGERSLLDWPRRMLANLLGKGDVHPLKDWPRRKHIQGIGMSDWLGYANLLGDKFSYENTFYDRQPQLDIQNPTPEQLGKCDFVISTDVFEHILQPLQQGFDNLLALLKPGGCLIFSVPYSRSAQTLEHFPDLHEFEILDFRGGKILVNRKQDGALQVRDDLIFHGGEGATLEMRLFCEDDVLGRLARAGFEDITVHQQPQLAIGYYWPELPSTDPDVPLYAYIVSARRPGSAS